MRTKARKGKAEKRCAAGPALQTGPESLSEPAGADPHDAAFIPHKPYKAELHDLQVECVKLQRQFIRRGDRIPVLLEGRDSAGKDGSIKRIRAQLNPRDTRVVALGKSSGGDLPSGYFERCVGQLPKAEERVLFNRSGYQRGGVERVMRSCSKRQVDQLMHAAARLERTS